MSLSNLLSIKSFYHLRTLCPKKGGAYYGATLLNIKLLKFKLCMWYLISTFSYLQVNGTPKILTRKICNYPKLKGKVLSSDKAINPFFRWIQILFSLASQPAANAVLSTLRFNLLANSGIEISPISFRAHQTFPALFPTIVLSMAIFINNLVTI